ncbi:MAG: energy transducer TonB [Alphaproteobacteria bacterium HGW-Alphaproteobacteria-13]|jgi:protein TonB|nr:MAG: energy transducer TonB [Alphaproteobacteria bacterium HGW-Alphaproteobacteria-13]
MTYTGRLSGRQRMLSGGGALLAAAAIGIGLTSGLDFDIVRKASETISAIAVPAPPPPPEPATPAPTQGEKASGKASPTNKHARAAPVAAPKPKLPPIAPPPVPAAPNPGSGSETSAGASATAGPGSGAGGQGDGTGAGGSGSGTGSGGSKAVLLSGRITDRDYPREASRARVGGEVEVRFTIQPNGRVSRCRVSRSSGDASLDATTCRLIEERFRFKPATNAAGEPVASQYGWRQSWWLERRR